MNKVKSNILYNMAYQILILIVPLITTPYISRVLLPDGIGYYSITVAITKYFIIFSHLGMANYGNRCIAKVRDNKEQLSITFWNLFYFQSIISILIIILYIAYISFWGYNKYGIVIICQIPYILSSIFEVSWFFYGNEQFKLIVIKNVIIKIITAILIFIFVKDIKDVWIYTLINSLSLLIGQICLWPNILKNISITKPKKELILNHLKPNLILFISVVAVSAHTLMDKVMLDLLSNKAELGYYENSYKIMDICCCIIGAIGIVMLPRITNLMSKKETNKINKYIDKSVTYIMMLAVGITFGLAGVAQEFSVIYFGENFAKSGIIMMAISPTILLYSWENILKTQYLLPNNKDKIYVKATICAAIVNVIINLLLIKKIGAVGAAIGTTLAMLASTIYNTMGCAKKLNIIKQLKKVLIYISFGIIMFLYCRCIGNKYGAVIPGLILQIIGGATIYILPCIIYLIKIKDDIFLKVIDEIKKLIKNSQKEGGCE